MVKHTAYPEPSPLSQLVFSTLQGYGPALLWEKVDVLDAIIVASEGERDPRCLLRVFDCVQAAVALYGQVQPEALAEVCAPHKLPLRSWQCRRSLPCK